MRTIKFMSVFFLSLSLLLTSCSKEGPQGEKGPQGEVGSQGPKGDVGSANVIYSDWLKISGDRDSTVDGSKLKVNYLAAPRLTTDLLKNSFIQVYMRFGTTIFPLPYTGNAGSKANTVSFIPMEKKICLTRFTHDNSGTLGFGAVEFRYIIIPGGVSARMASPAVDFSDFDAVCEYYGIDK